MPVRLDGVIQEAYISDCAADFRRVLLRGRCGRSKDKDRTDGNSPVGRTRTHTERSWPTAMKFSFDHATAPAGYWFGASRSARFRDDIARADPCLQVVCAARGRKL
eukprot:14665-Pelagococcus_subviridis.AAC.1